MTQKSEETGDLGVMRRRGKKRLLNETVEEMAFDLVERESGSQYSSSSSRVTLCDLSISWSTV